MTDTTNFPTTEDAATLATAAPSLTLQDLALTHQLLELSSQRGTWRADELTTVGTLYDRLTAFLKSVEANQAKTEAPTE